MVIFTPKGALTMGTIKLLLLNSDGLAFVIAIVTIVSTYYLSRRTSSQEIGKEQHDKLISPIFFLLEPHLFQNINNNSLEKVLNLIEQNKPLVDGKLLEIAYFCKKNPSQSNYNALCSYVNKTYDKSCKRLGLKRRSIEYRLARKQYQSKLSLFFYFSVIILRSLFIFGISLLIFSSFINLGFYAFDSISSPENQITFLFFIGAFLFLLLNYLDRKL